MMLSSCQACGYERGGHAASCRGNAPPSSARVMVCWARKERVVRGRYDLWLIGERRCWPLHSNQMPNCVLTVHTHGGTGRQGGGQAGPCSAGVCCWSPPQLQLTKSRL